MNYDYVMQLFTDELGRYLMCFAAGDAGRWCDGDQEDHHDQSLGKNTQTVNDTKLMPARAIPGIHDHDPTMLMLAVAIDPVDCYFDRDLRFGVTAVAWVTIGRVSGEDKPRAEARLDRMRSRRRDRRGRAKQENQERSAGGCLEKATSPMAEKLTGNEKEMGEHPRDPDERRLPPRIGACDLQRPASDLRPAFGLVAGGVTGLIADGMTQGTDHQSRHRCDRRIHDSEIRTRSYAKAPQRKVFLGLPDALDLMVVCVEAGLGMDQALRKVAEEMKKSHKEIGEEFAIANQQLAVWPHPNGSAYKHSVSAAASMI